MRLYWKELAKIFRQPFTYISFLILLVPLITFTVKNVQTSKDWQWIKPIYDEYGGVYSEEKLNKLQALTPADAPVAVGSKDYALQFLESQYRKNIFVVNSIDVCSKLAAGETYRDGDYVKVPDKNDQTLYRFITSQLVKIKSIDGIYNQYEYGFLQYLSFPNNIYVLMIIIVALAGLYANEYQTGMAAIQISARKGHKPLVLAKIGAGFTFALIIVLVYIISLLLIIAISGGRFMALKQPIQAMLIKELTYLPVTIGQYLVLAVIMALMLSLITAAMAMLLSSFTGNGVATTLFCVFLLILLPFIIEGLRAENFAEPYKKMVQLIDLLPVGATSMKNDYTELQSMKFTGLPFLPVVFRGSIMLLIYSVINSLLVIVAGRRFTRWSA